MADVIKLLNCTKRIAEKYHFKDNLCDAPQKKRPRSLFNLRTVFHAMEQISMPSGHRSASVRRHPASRLYDHLGASHWLAERG